MSINSSVRLLGRSGFFALEKKWLGRNLALHCVCPGGILYYATEMASLGIGASPSTAFALEGEAPAKPPIVPVISFGRDLSALLNIDHKEMDIEIGDVIDSQWRMFIRIPIQADVVDGCLLGLLRQYSICTTILCPRGRVIGNPVNELSRWIAPLLLRRSYAGGFVCETQ